jgi:hypothetical protein
VGPPRGRDARAAARRIDLCWTDLLVFGPSIRQEAPSPSPYRLPETRQPYRYLPNGPLRLFGQALEGVSREARLTPSFEILPPGGKGGWPRCDSRPPQPTRREPTGPRTRPFSSPQNDNLPRAATLQRRGTADVGDRGPTVGHFAAPTGAACMALKGCGGRGKEASAPPAPRKVSTSRCGRAGR